MKRINLIVIDAPKRIFKIYGVEQPHKPYQMKAEITYGYPIERIVTTDLIKKIVIFVEKEDKKE